jgi:hypothetical protein
MARVSSAFVQPPKEARMAVVIANTITGGDEEMYESVTKQVMGDQLPDGCQVHIAGPVPGGWRVITVWDSDQDFNRFRDEKLIPVLREARGDEAIAPNIETNPVHRMMTA